MYFTVDTLRRLYIVIQHGYSVTTVCIGSTAALQCRLGTLNKDHYRRLCPVPHDGIVKEIGAVRVAFYFPLMRLGLWFPSIPYQEFNSSPHGLTRNRRHYDQHENKHWEINLDTGHNCPFEREYPDWVMTNLQTSLTSPFDRRVTVDLQYPIQTGLEAWEVACSGYTPVIPSSLEQNDNPNGLVISITRPLPVHLRTRFEFRGVDPLEWEELPYASYVYFEVDAPTMRCILDILVKRGIMYPKVKELLLGGDELSNNGTLLEIARFFPRLLCVRSYSENLETQQMGAKVFGDLWHPLE